MVAIEAVTTIGETAALCQSVGLARATLYRRRQPARPVTPTVRAASSRALVAEPTDVPVPIAPPTPTCPICGSPDLSPGRETGASTASLTCQHCHHVLSVARRRG